MNTKHLFVRSALAAAIAITSTSAFSAGFQLNGQSATGLGRAFAGDAVIADNPSVMSRNAAAISLFDSPEISLGVIAIDTDVTVKNTTYTSLFTGTSTLPDEKVGDTSYVPNIFYVHPISKQLTLGAGIYSNFGTKTEFSDSFAANEMGGLTDVKTVNFALSAAYRFNQHFSIGLGLDVITGSGELKRHNSAIPVIGANLANIDAEGVGLGWNTGVVYELNKNHRFGLSYRHSPDIEVDGTLIQNGSTMKGDLIIRLPDMAEFSGFHQLDKKFAVHYSIQWIEWATFDKLATTGGQLLNEYNWQDGWHYAIGATYNLDDVWTLRTGYMFDTSAQDQKKSISVPDSDRQWLSAGFNYKFSKQGSIDVGMTYLVGKDTLVNESTSISSITATTRANAWLYGVQYNYTF